MKKQFIIGVGANATISQDKAFLQFLKGAELNYWHWIKGIWLVIDKEGRFSAGEFRDKLKECYPKIRTLVLEEARNGEKTWAGFGPNTPDKDMFIWIKERWNQADEQSDT